MSTLKVNTLTPLSGGTVNVDGNLTVGGASISGFPYTGSAAVSGAFLITGSDELALRVTGSSTFTGSLYVSGTVSGSFIGDGSGLTGLDGFPYTGSAAISGTFLVTGSDELAVRITGSAALTGSLYVSGTISGSYIGDGSQLTGIEAGGFPHTGSADITGSLIVTGSAFVTTLTETSALRYKKYVKDLQPQTDTLYQLRPVHFRWKNNNKKDFGLIAEEVQKIYPELVSSGEDGDALGISYTKLSAVLIKTVQELTDRVKELEQKLK